MKSTLKRIVLFSFFLIFLLTGCSKDAENFKVDLPGEEFVDALLTRDTITLENYLDTFSIDLLDVYSIPFIWNVKDVRYRLVVSQSPFQTTVPIYQFTVIFPWKEHFYINLIYEENSNKWMLPLSFYISKEFSSFSEQSLSYFYPPDLSPEVAKLRFYQIKRFIDYICSKCRGCCNLPFRYIYANDLEPSVIYRGVSFPDKDPIYLNGLCISKKSIDTLSILHALLDKNNYLYPFVEGVYMFYFGKHERFGFDYGDWIKSNFLSSGFKLVGKNLAEKLIFYKPIAGPLGYVFFDYLTESEHLSQKEVLNRLFSLTPEERRIVENEGNIELFYRKYVRRVVNIPMDSLEPLLGNFIFSKYRDISKLRDTVRFLRDEKRNVTFVISSMYPNARKISGKLALWIDSLNFFHKPYYTFLFVPIWLADSFKRILTPANSYWVAAYEFKSEDQILEETKKEYATFLVSDFIKTYSLQEKQLPMWFSLGLPMYLACGMDCKIDLGSVVSLPKSKVIAFYTNPMKTTLPSKAILLSYLMVRLMDSPGKGNVLNLLEKSVSNLNFSSAYKEVMGKSIRELIDKWKIFVEDTLYLKVSRK